jgi:hypothetical protein
MRPNLSSLVNADGCARGAMSRRAIKSRYRGRCCLCGAPYAVDDTIYWARRGGVACAECVDLEAAITDRDAAAGHPDAGAPIACPCGRAMQLSRGQGPHAARGDCDCGRWQWVGRAALSRAGVNPAQLAARSA